MLKFPNKMNKKSIKSGKTKARKAETSPVISGQPDKTCRACLQEGEMPINNSESNNLLDALRIYGEIEIAEDDPFPKYMCKACYGLLQSAIKFRETIQHSDKLLRQSVKQEDRDDDSTSHSSEHHIPDSQEHTAEPSIAKTVVKIENAATDDVLHNPDPKPKIKVNPKVQCDVCKKSISKYYYKDHLALHGYGTPKQKIKADCKICNKSVERSYFKQHMSTVHGKEHSKYVCFICGKAYRFQSGYKSHILTHSNEFPYKCQHCAYRGRHLGLLKSHMRTHERDYKYGCSECVARFLTSGNLNKHMLKHKEKTFKCGACTRSFHTKTEQEQHYQVDHLGVKSHVCNVCDKAFGYRKAMMKHISRIHRRTKQQCGRLPSYSSTVPTENTKEQT